MHIQPFDCHTVLTIANAVVSLQLDWIGAEPDNISDQHSLQEWIPTVYIVWIIKYLWTIVEGI